MKGHQHVLAECEVEDNSIAMCRQTLQHTDVNVFQWKPITFTSKQLSSCYLELAGLQAVYYSTGEKEGQCKEEYVTVFMNPCDESSWEEWLKQFTLQTGCEYTIHSGIQKKKNPKKMSSQGR